MKKSTKEVCETGEIDEMEKAIMTKAALCAWISLEFGLLIFTICYSCMRQTFDLLSAVPLVMAIISLILFFVAKACFTKDMTKTEDGEDEE